MCVTIQYLFHEEVPSILTEVRIFAVAVVCTTPASLHGPVACSHNASHSLVHLTPKTVPVLHIATFLLLLEWHLAYKESLDKHGSVLVDVTQCIFTGTSAVGKSSLKHLLVHNTPKAVKTSTAVMATPEVVSISSEQYAVEGGSSAWQLVDDDVMGKSLYECVTSKAYSEETELPQEHDAVLRVERKDNPAAMATDGAKESGDGDSDNDVTDSDGYSEIIVSDMLYKKLARREGCNSINLKDASFIHLLDTGGQPSFQDALPLLLDAPCTYIQVFNAARDLDQPVPITYRSDDHTEESLPPSAETGWEMMLRSFSSMQTMALKCSKELATIQQEGGQLPQMRIFVVGTFKDQLVEEGRLEEAVKDVSKRLRDLEVKPYYCCIRKDRAGQPFYLINNMADKEEDRASVNSLRKNLSSARYSFKLKVPLRWYICKQITQAIPQKFFRYQILKAFCLKLKFIDANGADEQLHSLLKLFSLLGFYVFFDLQNLPDEANYVCTDKGVFLKEVSKLLAIQFLQTPRCHAVEAFKQDGIISNNMELFEELGIIAEVDRSWFLAALEHVGLLARYASATNHSASYFMPTALPQGKTKLPGHGSVASLCVTFSFHSPDNPRVYTDLPRGVFCRLAVQLSNGPWTPIPRESDRTTVKFRSDEFDLYLTEAPGFISLTPVLVEELEGEEPLTELHKLCHQLYDTLHKSIVPSAEDVLGEQFNQTAKIVFGFECGCGSVPHLAILATAKAKSLLCQATNERRKLLSQQRIWFAPVKCAEVSGLSV